MTSPSSPGSETPPQTTAPDRRPGEAAAFVVTIVLLVAIALLGVTLWKTIGKDFTKATPATAAAGDAAPAEDPVLVTVNGEEIRQAEFDAAVARLPREMQGVINSPEGRKALAEELVRMKTLEQYARQNALDREPEVAAAVAVAQAEILANAAIRDLVATQKEVTPRELYDRNRQQFEAVKLSQIVIPFQGSVVAGENKNVPSEQEAFRIASEIAGRLRGGADFAAVAKQISADRQTAERGGDLGLVGHGTFPDDVDRMIFSLPVGAITDPVRTGYGMHVFKVTEKQNRSFEEVEQALVRSGKQLQARNVADDLRAKAKVDFNPKYFPQEAAKPAAAAPAAKK